MTDEPSRGRHFILPLSILVAITLLIGLVNHFYRGEPPASGLGRGVAWLAVQQWPDGSWRGVENSVLRPGPAMTAFTLYAFTRLPEVYQEHFSEAMARAATYLESNLDPSGFVGQSPNGLDYPNYATSLTLLSFVAMKRESTVARMVDALKRAQLDEGEGWMPSDPEYGGWAFGGPPRPKPEAHRLDMSHTRFALEALAAAAVPPDDPVWERARKFLATCQNRGRDPRDDGGFFFTPLRPFQNKAGHDPKSENEAFQFSYGTATADGVLSLRAAGGAPDRLEAAEAWIRTKFVADRSPGFPADHPRPWAEGLAGYWAAAASRITDDPGRTRLAQVLAARQKPDGSWGNDVDLMLENERLLATVFAVLALAETVR